MANLVVLKPVRGCAAHNTTAHRPSPDRFGESPGGLAAMALVGAQPRRPISGGWKRMEEQSLERICLYGYPALPGLYAYPRSAGRSVAAVPGRRGWIVFPTSPSIRRRSGPPPSPLGSKNNRNRLLDATAPPGGGHGRRVFSGARKRENVWRITSGNAKTPCWPRPCGACLPFSSQPCRNCWRRP
ncbi:MAG: hypothetical protein BWZ10_00374 [candidate division BRC1 bacterium ADurb.BinA364]|nr:MAG: hypothetical protein BWZ10_00374 [candidate division BRC1 bacterium ADurb.BinA364]